ncbi:MAG: Arm DNA-binding domain-containing protein [Bilophila wadsworthia]
MSLTDTAIRAAKPAKKQQKLFDAKGLYLLITPGGTKSWRLKYHFQGKEKLISLGTYPATSLKEARKKPPTPEKPLRTVLTRPLNESWTSSLRRTPLSWWLWNGLNAKRPNGRRAMRTRPTGG